ncbi:MAG TPA: hypothetical protein VLK82_09185, partial [Candidatus Tectomicrobia bacterium]|nr:hypothetical protein [Candidatus Tectomicrobia bacterium]
SGRIFAQQLHHIIYPGASHPLRTSELASIQRCDTGGIIQQIHVNCSDFSWLQADVFPDHPLRWWQAFQALLIRMTAGCL